MILDDHINHVTNMYILILIGSQPKSKSTVPVLNRNECCQLSILGRLGKRRRLSCFGGVVMAAYQYEHYYSDQEHSHSMHFQPSFVNENIHRLQLLHGRSGECTEKLRVPKSCCPGS